MKLTSSVSQSHIHPRCPVKLRGERYRGDVLMRVTCVMPAVTNEASGPTYAVLRLCESLIPHCQEVTLAALDWAPVLSPPEFLKTFPLGFAPRRLGGSPAMRRWLNLKVMSHGVDLLHNHGMWQMNSVYPAWALKYGSINLVVSPHGAFAKWAMKHGSVMKKAFWFALQLPALKRATCFHATAESEYEDIRRLGFRQPIAIIPFGIDIPEALPKEKKDSRTLLFLGRIHPVKGLDILLPAWRAVQDRFPEWKLIVVGSDKGHYGSNGYLNKMIKQAEALDLRRVSFIGELHGAEKRSAYQRADLFVLPSYSENFAVTVAESLAAGTPVVASKGTPWSDLVCNDAGWWPDVGVDPLVACLEDALSRSPTELTYMGQRGRSWMERDFAWKSIGTRMSETYRWLCDRALPVPPWVRLD